MYKTFYLPKGGPQQLATPSLHHLTDSDLITRYIKGDEECIAVLINRHKNRIFIYIMKYARNQALAEDIFQETFFKVIRSLKGENYNEEDKFLPWTLRIAKNLIIDYFRRVRKHRMISSVKNREGGLEDIFNIIDIGENVSRRHIEKRQSHRQIRHLIKQLPFEQRQILIMREYLDMSFNEICEMMDMNLNTALGRMRYAILSLKKMAKEENLQL